MKKKERSLIEVIVWWVVDFIFYLVNIFGKYVDINVYESMCRGIYMYGGVEDFIIMIIVLRELTFFGC